MRKAPWLGIAFALATGFVACNFNPQPDIPATPRVVRNDPSSVRAGNDPTSAGFKALTSGYADPMAKDDRLADYHAKRDPERTPKPSGSGARKGRKPRFVVQRHDARSLHFDFRLEIDGVLVSWSVPKGPSLNPGKRRLAIRTEDHPLEYLDFEGVIPNGDYGGGTVIVWDKGTDDNLTDEPAARALGKGHLKVDLHGKKLTGAFSLIRTDLRGAAGTVVTDQEEGRRGGPPPQAGEDPAQVRAQR